MKKIVFVVAPEVFRDEEYIEPKTILEAAGIEVTTASTVIGEIYGKIKIKAQSQMLAKDIKVENFDGIFFVGGGGAAVYFEDETVHNIAKQFYDKGKIVSAICIAPVILANAGLLQNKKATVCPDGADALLQNGAIYTGNPVEVDGKIINSYIFSKHLALSFYFYFPVYFTYNRTCRSNFNTGSFQYCFRFNIFFISKYFRCNYKYNFFHIILLLLLFFLYIRDL